jgi:hypothetical protein
MRSAPYHETRIRPRAARTRDLVLAAILGLAPTVVGCFDRNTLVEAKQEESILVQLDEIDLGKFRITLPGALPATNGGIVEFHAFGQVAKRDRAKVSTTLKLNEPEFRYRLILAVRSMTEKELTQPALKRLRSELTKLANAPLEHGEIKSVGFYEFAFAPPAEQVAAAAVGSF